MRVIRATEMGMCFGVKDALQVAASVPDPSQVTIHGELVHNPDVTRRLAHAGFRQSRENSRQSGVGTPIVLITAHGVSVAERDRLAATTTTQIDTTCPLVRRAHDAAQELQDEGRHIVLIGTPGHVEVRGIVEDLDSYDVVAEASEVRCYGRRRLGIMSQTTMPGDVVARVAARVRELNPRSDTRAIDTVCQPTKLRQQALVDLMDDVDAVVVVGGRNSNNTRRLVRLCLERYTPALQVESAVDLDADWFAGVDTVGLTAGTSTLNETIDEVHDALTRLPAGRRTEGSRCGSDA
jgi:4-hydroxy-3-methylbut-2-enyl diphosphate reductase